jgi:Raf kinase inhibitor-like YbhB/YbcL family protein
MHGLRLSTALLFTSSVFLVHCSDDDAPGGANDAGTSSTTGGSTSTAGTGGSVAGTPASGASAGQGISGGSAGSGGSGTGLGGAGAGGTAGVAGRGTAGTSGSGMAGSSTAGTGTSTGGMSGAGGTAGNGSGGAPAGSGGRAAGGTGTGGTSGGSMTLTSSVLTEGGMFADANTCASGTSGNKSPDLTWSAGPSGTLSYAVVLLDTSITLNHWVIWDIPANVTMLPAALETTAMPATPAGAKQKSFQGNGYQGPCPSGMDHVYQFTVYALPVASVTGAMTSEQPAAIVMDIMNANPLGSASLSAHSSATRP